MSQLPRHPHTPSKVRAKKHKQPARWSSTVGRSNHRTEMSWDSTRLITRNWSILIGHRLVQSNKMECHGAFACVITPRQAGKEDNIFSLPKGNQRRPFDSCRWFLETIDSTLLFLYQKLILPQLLEPWCLVCFRGPWATALGLTLTFSGIEYYLSNLLKTKHVLILPFGQICWKQNTFWFCLLDTCVDLILQTQCAAHSAFGDSGCILRNKNKPLRNKIDLPLLFPI